MEPFRREGVRVRVSVDGGGQPKWRADGQRFLVKLSVDEGEPAVMHVVTNWQSLPD